MAVNALYDKGRQKVLEGSIPWLTADIKAVLIDINAGGGYTVNLASDEFLSIIPLGARISTSANLANKTSTAGVADADDTSFPGTVAGTVCEAIALYKDTGAAATSPLIYYADSGGVTNLPVTTNGVAITLQFNNGPDKIFKI